MSEIHNILANTTNLYSLAQDDWNLIGVTSYNEHDIKDCKFDNR